MDPLALLDGEPAPAIATTAAHLHGVTCFETVGLAGGDLVHLDRHLDRLAIGLGTLSLEPPDGLAGVRARIEEGVAAWPASDGIVRVSVHATGPMRGLHLADRSASVLVVVQEARYPDLADGVDVITSTRRAPDPEAVPTTFKAPNLARLLAHREARKREAFEGLMLDARGHVVSGTRSNVFAVIGDQLVTPPAPPALPGVTRGLTLEVADELGIDAEARRLHRDELPEATELFLTFTGPGVVPVATLDGAPVAQATPGPVTGRCLEQL